MKNLRQMLHRASWLNSRKRKARPQSESKPRRLSSQTLEKRELLAGDVGIAHNGWNAFDVNDDRQITSLDALIGINRLAQFAESERLEADGMFLDVNNDGELTASDPLRVINALSRGEELGELVELLLTARDLNDNEIQPDANGFINLGVNEEFNIELSYDDLRRGDNEIGAFQLFVDLETSTGGVLKPVLNETQQIRFDDAIDTPFIQIENTLPTGKFGIAAEVINRTIVDNTQTSESMETLVKFFEFIESGSPADPDDIGILTRNASNQPLSPEEIAIEVASQINAVFVDTTTVDGVPSVVPVLDANFVGNTVFIENQDRFLDLENQADDEPANASGHTSLLSGNLTFIQETSGNTYVSQAADFDASASDEIANALTEFGYTPDQYQIKRLPQGDGYEILFTDLDELGNENLLNFSVTDNLNIAVPTQFTEIAPFNLDGTVNSSAVRFNLDTHSRTFNNNSEFFNSLNQGSFDDATGFGEIGGTGQVPPNGLGVPELSDDGLLTEPFDVFSIRVFFDSAVSNFTVSANPGETRESTLLYGRNTEVPQDLVLIDSDAVLTFNVGDGANNLPVGIPTISGTAQEDETLTANTSGISDADGLGTFSYQWLRGGVAISGATSSTYALGDADVGQAMSVQVSYTDGLGTPEGPLTSAQTAPVANINDAPSGVPTITGAVQAEATLTANTSGISDADGLGTFSFQWLRGSTPITGATSSTYLLGDADIGQLISVQVSYTDGQGTPEGPLTSAQVGPVANANNNLPSGVPTITGTAQEDETLTANTSGISDADGLGTFSYQWLRGSTNISGATSSTYVLGDADVGQTISVQVRYTDGLGTAEGPLTSAPTAQVANVNDAPTGVPTISGTAQEDETLTAVTSGISDADGLGTFSYQWLRGGVAISGATSSTYVLGDADVGQAISVQVRYTDGQGTAEGPLTSAPTAQVANVNDAPSGVPTISGLIQKDETLTAVTSGISDADGLGAFSYQWLRGSVAISGATSSSYLLGDADVGQRISVQVSYTDGQGTPESLTSAQTAPVGSVNSPPVGTPTITGTVQEDQRLTANTSGISDADGLGAFSYQWLRGGVAIGGATSSTYLLGDADVGQRISVQVSYTDGQGTDEGPLTSAQTVPVVNVNDAPQVSDSISRTFNEFDPATSFSLLQFATDVDGDTLNVSNPSVTSGNGIGVMVVGNFLEVDPGAYADLLDVGDTEVIVVSFDIIDGNGGSVSQTATVTIEAVPPTMVTGLVYIDELDVNNFRNGGRDADEYGIGGVTVRMRAVGSSTVRTTLTDAHGDYIFAGVAPGTYEVEYVLPNNAVIIGSSVSTVVVGATSPAPDVLPVLGFTGSLGNIDILASTYLSGSSLVSSGGRMEGGKFGLGSGGTQEMFVLLEGFEGIEFAEFVLNADHDAALLSLVDGDGTVQTALVGEDAFVLSPDGRAAALIGAKSNFDFQQSVDDVLGQEFPGFGDSVQDYLATE